MKYLVTILFILIPVLAQNPPERQIQIADSLFETGEYFKAVTEYKRLLFFDKSDNYNFAAHFKIGLSYKSGARFDNAVRFLALALNYAVDNEEKYAVKEQLVRVNILRRTTSQAHYLLNELASESGYSRNNLYYWRGWIFMFEDKWDEAAYEFDKIDSNHPLKVLCESVNNEKYSVTLARILSYVLPGSGQFYAGEYLSGFMSLGWNALWGFITVNSFIEERVFDGLMVGNLLWLRFYRGNYQNAEKFTLQKNIEILNETYRYLQNSYEGIKP